MEITRDVSLKPYTWWKIGGPAEYFARPTSLDEVRAGLSFARAHGLAVTILGGGTNVLVADEGVAGLVMCFRLFRGLEVTEADGRVNLIAWAGTPKSDLTKEFLKRRLAPALFLCGLPGDVGGGVVMNAGIGEQTTPREFREIVDWVEVIGAGDRGDADAVTRLGAGDLIWGYRHSEGWQPGVVVRVGLSWPSVPDAEVPDRVRRATRTRVQRQPLDLPSCGSTFKNPPGSSAGALIEAAGLKGYRVGDAMVSPKHANFIVNVGHATAADVRAVIAHVREVVHDLNGVALETEVKFIGR